MPLSSGCWIQLVHLLIKMEQWKISWYLTKAACMVQSKYCKGVISGCLACHLKEWIDKWCFRFVIHRAWRFLHRLEIHCELDFYFLLHVSQMPPLGLLYLMQLREGCMGEIWLEQYLQSFPEVQGKATFDILSELLGVTRVSWFIDTVW